MKKYLQNAVHKAHIEMENQANTSFKLFFETMSTSPPRKSPKKGGGSNVRVMCRVRPQNSKELKQNDSFCVELTDTAITLEKYQTFTFDRCFGPDSSQNEVFDFVAKPLIRGFCLLDSLFVLNLVIDVLCGFNGTIFAYGQTSSGKTHTMQVTNLLNASRFIAFINKVGSFDF